MKLVKNLVDMISDILAERNVLWGLAKNDVKARFAASHLGVVWAFVQPLMTLLVFWFVFQIGFRSAPVSDVPFIIWFAPAYLIWTFFSETVIAGTNCLLEYSYLVKKVNFRVSMLPLVKIVSAMFVHAGFILFVFLMLLVCGVPFSIHNIQVIYYFLSTCVLLAGLCWLLSAILPFAKDVNSIVGVVIQIGFWMTPVFWAPEEMAPWVYSVLRFNPMFYICQGYRDCFIAHIWFWERGVEGIIFWAETIIVLLCGAYMFRKLRPQFADVL